MRLRDPTLISPIKTLDCSYNSDLSVILKHHRIAICQKSENKSNDIKIYEEHKAQPTIVISNAHNSRISALFEFDHGILVSFSYSEKLIKFWSIRKYDYKLLHTLDAKDINSVYRLRTKLVTIHFKNDDTRESTLHLWNVHHFENKWEKELKFRGEVSNILELEGKDLIVVSYIDETPEDRIKNDGVLFINSLTFQVVSNIKHNGMTDDYPLIQFDNNRVLMGGGNIFLIDLEKKTIESISKTDCRCLTKLNDEIVLFEGIRKRYFLDVNNKKVGCSSKEEEGRCLYQLVMINDKEFYGINDYNQVIKYIIKEIDLNKY